MNLSDKNILITGGSSGLGLACAKLLTPKSAHVFILGRHLKTLNQAKTEIEANNITIIQADVADYQDLKRALSEIDSIDVLINCAGVWLEGQLPEYDPDKISQLIDVNVKGVIYATHLVLPQMLERNNGFIINVSSTYGLRGRENGSVYTASKFAVRGFTESLELDLEKTNVKVTGFYPGGMKTKLFDNAQVTKDTQHYIEPIRMAEVMVFILERDESMIIDQVEVERRKFY